MLNFAVLAGFRRPGEVRSGFMSDHLALLDKVAFVALSKGREAANFVFDVAADYKGGFGDGEFERFAAFRAVWGGAAFQLAVRNAARAACNL